MMALLSSYVRMFRKRSGLAQHEVAVLLGCKHGSKVSRYERGERRPALATIIAYELVFHANLRALFAGEFARIAPEVKRRAQKLSRHLDAQPFTPSVKRKLDFLADVVFPPSKKKP